MASHFEESAREFRFARRPVWSGRRRAQVVLTFDDGPHPTHTIEVLDCLAEARVSSAAFFVLGSRVSTAADSVRRAHQAGYPIGNHTFSHPKPTWFGFREAYRQLEECQRAVSTVAGVRPTLFRPPMGKWTPPLRWASLRHGLRPMGWTLDSGDWRVRGPDDADRCGAELLRLVQPGDVILLHDYHPWIGRILNSVLPELATRGLI
jgi:peptidoglycan/xylan/chitin deacetylase (PgdA/CDA1 family)